MEAVKANLLRTEVPRDKNGAKPLPQWAINKQIGAMFLDMPKHLAHSTGMVLEQLTIRKTEGGWQLILKATKDRRNLVTFLDCDTFLECMELGGEYVYRDGLDYRPDKYPPKRKR